MMTSPAVLIRRHGGPEVLEITEVPVQGPAGDEIQVDQVAIGLNYSDIYQRAGAHGPHYPAPLPIVLGSQGAGRVVAVGENVREFRPGDFVVYLQSGAYQAIRNVKAALSLLLPEGMSAEQAAALLLRGMTAEYLLHRLYKVEAEDVMLVHAAAGGMGQLLASWGNALGATVIGTVGSAAKVPTAHAAGCHNVINYREEDFVERVEQITSGRGVHVVYDAVGKDVFLDSLRCLRGRGMAINYGTASGDVEAFDLQLLHAKSITVSRPTLRSFVSTTVELRKSAAVFAAAVRNGHCHADVAFRYPLRNVRVAHEHLESRMTAGAGVLIPD